MSLIVALISIAAFFIALTIHEFCHAATAFFLGDRTAQRFGRLTLNPAAHIDPVGTLLVPLIGLISGLPVIGWAKPVPVNPYNLRHGKWGHIMVGLAGPVSNFAVAFVFLGALKLVYSGIGLSSSNLLVIFLVQLVTISVVLGIFNLLPVPPLDGSTLLTSLLDAPKYRRTVRWLETRGTLILFLILILDSFAPVSILGRLFNGAVGWVFGLAGL